MLLETSLDYAISIEGAAPPFSDRIIFTRDISRSGSPPRHSTSAFAIDERAAFALDHDFRVYAGSRLLPIIDGRRRFRWLPPLH